MKLAVIAVLLLVVAGLAASCESDQQIEFKRYYTTGKIIYEQRCQNCHGRNGEGLSSLIPPLTDGEYLKTNKAFLACLMTDGVKNKMMRVAGKTYVGNMPAPGLAPIDAAKVITYITNSFGNKMGTTNVDEVNKQLADCK